jgi:hypothetical protein
VQDLAVAVAVYDWRANREREEFVGITGEEFVGITEITL